MKFIKLESRGGNYLVVAENVAWLRTAENGQTNVGIIGGQPLLVVGSIEEVAAKILAGTTEEQALSHPAVAEPAPVAQARETRPTMPSAPLEPAPAPEPAVQRPAASVPPARPRPVSARSASQWERPSSAAPTSLKIKSGSQRMMGMLD